MKQILGQGVYDGKVCQLVVETVDDIDTCQFEPITEGFLHDIISGATSFAKAHPFLTAIGATWAWDAIHKYKQASKAAMRLYSPDSSSRGQYFKMVDEMKKNGYYVTKQGWHGGSGYYWELDRR